MVGLGNGNFNVSGNWLPGGVPAAGDDLVFQTGVTQLLVTNDFSPNRAFNSLLFQGSNYFVRGNAILVTNGINSINPVGPNHIDADVDVRASQPGRHRAAGFARHQRRHQSQRQHADGAREHG